MRRSGSPIINLLAGVMVLLSICTCGYYAGVFLQPNTILNPFPSPAPPVLAVIATAVPPTNTPPVLPSPFTPTPTSTATATREPSPTNTAVLVVPGGTEGVEPTPTRLGDTGGATGTPAAGSGFRYTLQSGSPVATIYIPGCNYMGVSGRVFDADGDGVNGLIMRIEGPTGAIDTFTDTINDQDGSYEAQLAAAPAATTGEWLVQVLSDSGDVLSEEIVFDTFAECNRNLILINFVETGP